MGVPVVKQVEFNRETLPGQYAELLRNNPLLARIEGSARSAGLSDLEIRTGQLLTAVASNASLQARLTELETARARPLVGLPGGR